MVLTAEAIHPLPHAQLSSFASRRSVVHSLNGIIACSQPLAAVAGERILREGGNAADAAVAVAAALNMTEPCSTGIGGDMFCLFYDAKTKEIQALNGSGRSPASISLEIVRESLGLNSDDTTSTIPLTSVYAVTVPGAAAGWVDTVDNFGSGKLSMQQILAPAIELGEQGFPVSEISSHFWQEGESRLRAASPNFREMLKTDLSVRAPLPGELMRNHHLAQTFRTLAQEGKKGFYEGRIAEAMVRAVEDRGGFLSMNDLKRHLDVGSQNTEPVSLQFTGQNIANKSHMKGGVELWEHPPNGQGIVALMALGILEQLEKNGKIPIFERAQHNSTEYLHAIIESLRIAFADATWWVTDPDHHKLPDLLREQYINERSGIFTSTQATDALDHGSPAQQNCDTVYFAVADAEGNAISFINSNYHGFGTGIIPKDCGFTIQNRGANFPLVRDHPNAVAPLKRPYHTIIPAMITNANDGSLHSVFGVMGGFMQPQGQVQVLMNMLAFDMDPQAALDAPRVCIWPGPDRTVYVEDGISDASVEGLEARAHKVKLLRGWERELFGRGQIIRFHYDGRLIFSAGTDPRADGTVIPL